MAQNFILTEIHDDMDLDNDIENITGDNFEGINNNNNLTNGSGKTDGSASSFDKNGVVNSNNIDDGSQKNASSGVEDLIPTCVRYGKDPCTLRNIDPAIYGYDIAQMHSRPWSKPGVDISDYFNYGFNETTWRAYCALQACGINSMKDAALATLKTVITQNPTLLTQAGVNVNEIFGSQQQKGTCPAVPGSTAYHHSSTSVGGFANASGTSAGAYGINNPAGSGPSSNPLYKTRKCQQYMSGDCKRGSACTYAHDDSELRPGVNINAFNNNNAGGIRSAPIQPTSAATIPPSAVTPVNYVENTNLDATRIGGAYANQQQKQYGAYYNQSQQNGPNQSYWQSQSQHQIMQQGVYPNSTVINQQEQQQMLFQQQQTVDSLEQTQLSVTVLSANVNNNYNYPISTSQKETNIISSPPSVSTSSALKSENNNSNDKDNVSQQQSKKSTESSNNSKPQKQGFKMVQKRERKAD